MKNTAQIVLIFCTAAAICNRSVVAAQPQQIDASFASIADGSWSPTSAELGGFISELHEQHASGEQIDWDSARAIVNDPDLHSSLRRAALRLVIDLADDQMRAAVLTDVRAWVPQRLGEASPGDQSSVPIAYAAIEDLDGLTLGEDSMNAMADLLVTIMTSQTLSPSEFDRVSALVERYVEPDRMSEVAYAVILVHGNRMRIVDSRVVDWLRQPEIDRLREDFLEAPLETSSFNYGVPAALADLGDTTVLQELERRRKWASDQITSDRASALRTHARSMQRFIDLIEVQESPDALLEWVSEDQNRRGSTRAWAVQRAIEIGVAPEEVRVAVLRLNKNALEWAEEDGNPGEPGFALAVAQQTRDVSRVVIDNGIMAAEDIPTHELVSSIPEPRR